VKRIRKSRAARFLSWLLTVGMVAPMIRGVVAPMPAMAQGVAAGNEQSAIIVQFENKSGVQGARLSNFATTAVSNELEGQGRFQFVAARDVARVAEEDGVKAPYDQVALSRIASKLGASSIVTGEVAFVRSDTKGGAKTVRVGLKVRVTEANSGDLLNGAAQIGTAVARPGQDEYSLIEEAARNAAVLAAKEVMAYTLPEGIVLNLVGGKGSEVQVLINKGSRDGIKDGMQMIVFREKQRVGKIQVTATLVSDSEAKILENNYGFQPEDKVRAIFPMPDFSAAGNVVRGQDHPKASMGSLGKVLVVLLAGVVIWAAVGGGSNTSVTGVTAEADVQNGAPAVRIMWRDNLFAGNTLEYQVWRNPDAPYNMTGIPVASTTGNGRTYEDLPAPYSFWDGVRSFMRPAGSTSTSSGTTNNGGQGNATSVTPSTTQETPGFTPGQTYLYAINSVLRRTFTPSASSSSNSGSTNNGTSSEDIYSEVVNSGQVTPVRPAELGTTPQDLATNVDLGQFNPTWLSTAGADVFVVEVSTDRSFTNRNLIYQTPIIYSTAPRADGVTQALQAAVNLQTNAVLLRDAVFTNFIQRGGAKPTLFWRVGARNDSDRPGPVHWISRNHSDGDRTFRFVYSQIRSFTPADLPPRPPAGS